MFGSSAMFDSGERRVDHGREVRFRGSPRSTVARSTHQSVAARAFPAFLNSRKNGHQHTEALPGMGRSSALRTALQNGSTSRRSSETSVEEVQRRLGDFTKDQSARKHDSVATPSWEYQAPAQPRDSSPVTRPPSVRQRHAGLAKFPSGLGMLPARRRNSVFRDDFSDSSRAADEGVKVNDAGLIKGARSHAQSKATSRFNEVNRREPLGTCSESRRDSNQAEDPRTTPPRHGSSLNTPERGASSPSVSQYLESDLQRRVHATRRGSCSGKIDGDVIGSDGTPGRTSGTDGSAAGEAEGASDGVRSYAYGQESIRCGRVRPAPSTTPFARDIKRLPSIDGVETDAQEAGGRDGEYSSTAVGRRGGKASATSEYPTTSEERRRGDGVSGGGRSRACLVTGGREVSSGSHGVGVSVSGGVTTAASRRHQGLQTTSHAKMASASCGGSGIGVDADSITRPGECLVGLQNLGNTCFMNACLQCLLHTDDLVELFRRRVHEQRSSRKSRTQGTLAAAFGELLRLVESSPAYSNVSPIQVKNLVGRYAPHLSGYGQQDCQEFLRFFLDGLSEDLNRRSSGAGAFSHQQGEGMERRQSPPLTPPPLAEEAVARLPADQQANRAWALHLGRNDSEITSMFCGQLHSRISCLTCHNVSHCFDPFFDLSLPLPHRQQRGASGSAGDACGGGIGARDGSGGFTAKASGERLKIGLEYDLPRGMVGCTQAARLVHCEESMCSRDLTSNLEPRFSSVSAATKVNKGGIGIFPKTSSDSAGDMGSSSPCELEDCLRAFTMREILDGDNRPVCVRCRKRRKSAKFLAVHRFPPVLVIHLKRFQYDSTTRRKLSTVVDFPISRLDLAPFSTSGARPSWDLHRQNGLSADDPGSRGRCRVDPSCGDWDRDSLREGREDVPRSRASTDCGNIFPGVSPVYELYGVCSHVGGLEGGHYTAHCKGRSVGGCGGWHTFDDSRVSGVDPGRVGGASAYVLFYRLALVR